MTAPTPGTEDRPDAVRPRLPLGRVLALDEWRDVRLLTDGPDPRTDDPDRRAVASRDGVEVAGVRVTGSLRDPVPPLDGELLVVTVPVDRDDWQLDTLIRRTVAAGGSALVIDGHRPLSRSAALIARRLALPVLGAPEPLLAAVALRTHLALPTLSAARLVAAAAAAVRRAGSGGTGDSGVGHVVELAGAALDHPIWLVDSAGNVVAGPEPVWADGALAGTPADPLGGEIRSDGTVPRLIQLPVRTDDPRGARLLVAAGPADEPETLLTVLQVVAEAVAARLARQRLGAERDARLRTSLLAELLRSGGHLAAETPRRILEQNWALDGWHLGIRIDVPGPVDPVALRPDVLRAFAEARVPAQVVEQGNGWAAWTTFRETPGPAELQARSTAIRRVQWRLRAGLPSVMGIGSPQPGATGLVRSLGEAVEAAKVAVTRTAGGQLVQFDRLGLSRLLLAWTQTETFGPAAGSMLAPLADQPGDLLVTLSAYLDAESSTSEVAAVLGVHRNTVAARIARATELLGVDLGDPDERMALHLACRSVLARR